MEVGVECQALLCALHQLEQGIAVASFPGGELQRNNGILTCVCVCVGVDC